MDAWELTSNAVDTQLKHTHSSDKLDGRGLLCTVAVVMAVAGKHGDGHSDCYRPLQAVKLYCSVQFEVRYEPGFYMRYGRASSSPQMCTGVQARQMP